MMFTGIFGSTLTKYNIWFTVLAGICIILAAIYMLNMVRKIFYGELSPRTMNATDINLQEKLALGVIVILIFWMGIYPQTVLNVTNEVSDSILKLSDVRHLLK